MWGCRWLTSWGSSAWERRKVLFGRQQWCGDARSGLVEFLEYGLDGLDLCEGLVLTGDYVLVVFVRLDITVALNWTVEISFPVWAGLLSTVVDAPVCCGSGAVYLVSGVEVVGTLVALEGRRVVWATLMCSVANCICVSN